MTPEAAQATRKDLNAMREAKRELGQAHAYLSTEEALEASPIDVSEEMLTGYPDWVCPRIRKNPSRDGSPFLWDPRDIRALPWVLRQWAQARKNDREEEFKKRRIERIRQRERQALRDILGGDR